MISELASRTYTDVFILKRPEGNLRAAICFSRLPASCPFDEIVDVLHPRELEYYNTLKFDRRKRSYLLGRYAAKQAIAAFVSEKDIRNILIQQGIFNQPFVTCEDAHNVQVSITHCDELGAAIAFPESHPMGIDIERMNKNKREVIEGQMTEAEKELMKALPTSHDILLTLLWTVKEALSKVLKTGLMTPFKIFEVSTIKTEANYFVTYFEHFAQYKAFSFPFADYIYSITHPKKTVLDIDIGKIKKKLCGCSTIPKGLQYETWQGGKIA